MVEINIKSVFLWVFLGIESVVIAYAQHYGQPVPLPYSPPEPARYICYQAPDPIIIDGHLDEPAWARVPATQSFEDIEGKGMAPWDTRAKMLWDSSYLYISATLQESHLWATLTKRDAIIFHDNDFEVFIDPDGSTHNYIELEINALNTVWDLFLLKAYREPGGGPFALHEWDIHGLRTAVQLQGTLNDPSDRDTSWTVEIALPWAALKEASPRRKMPRAGDQWRINFSRVQWPLIPTEQGYEKKVDPATKKPGGENNFAWSPTGFINMHMPDAWGYVQFSAIDAGSGEEAFREFTGESYKKELRRVYYEQWNYHLANGRYADRLPVIPDQDPYLYKLELYSTPSGYEVVTPKDPEGKKWHMREDGKIWSD